MTTIDHDEYSKVPRHKPLRGEDNTVSPTLLNPDGTGNTHIICHYGRPMQRLIVPLWADCYGYRNRSALMSVSRGPGETSGINHSQRATQHPANLCSTERHLPDRFFAIISRQSLSFTHEISVLTLKSPQGLWLQFATVWYDQILTGTDHMVGCRANRNKRQSQWSQWNSFHSWNLRWKFQLFLRFWIQFSNIM